MKKVITVFILSSLPYTSFASTCAKKKEMEALDYRAIQSSMMVAALSCNKQKEYNKFMNKYKKEIVGGSNEIKTYFKRAYGKNYEYRLNMFMTQIANKATKASMTGAPDEYCEQIDSAFKELLNIDDNRLSKFKSRKKYSSIHGFNSC
jgi:hypothetical protein